jgi:DNA-binding transcriptional LysR family regulator
VRDARVILRANTTHMVLRAVRLGLGIGPVPCYLARGDRNLERVYSDSPVELDDLWLVVHADVQHTTRVRAVIEAVEARLAEVAEELSGEQRSRNESRR